MTPHGNADKLIDKYRPYAHSEFSESLNEYLSEIETENAIKCAMGECKGVIDVLNKVFRFASIRYDIDVEIEYWQETLDILKSKL